MNNHGRVRPGETLEFDFETFAGTTGAPVTITGLALGDILIYKDGGTTQRDSTAGFALLDTDGIDFDGITGIHGFTVDLADNTTVGFYTAGSRYRVVVSSVTVDGQVMSFTAGYFKIGVEGAIRDTTIATLASQTSFTLTAGPTNNNALKGCRVVVTDPTGATVAAGLISAYTGSTKTCTLLFDPGAYTMAAGDNISILPPDLADLRLISGSAIDTATAQIGVNAVSIATGAITAAAIATDAIDDDALSANAVTAIAAGISIPAASAVADAVWDEALSGHTTAGTAGKALSDAGGGGSGSVTVNLLYSGEYTMRAEDQYPDGQMILYVGETPRLYLHLRDAAGARINLSAHTVTATLTDRTGAEVGTEDCTAESNVLGIVYLDIPATWTDTAGQGFRLTATIDGASTKTVGPLSINVQEL